MNDQAALPTDHPLKSLETRLLEMCDDTHPALRVLMGNAVAALRVFAADHPGLHDNTCKCACCGERYDPYATRIDVEELNPYVYCRDCRAREWTADPCPKCGGGE